MRIVTFTGLGTDFEPGTPIDVDSLVEHIDEEVNGFLEGYANEDIFKIVPTISECADNKKQIQTRYTVTLILK